jgi:hypothetical protein
MSELDNPQCKSRGVPSLVERLHRWGAYVCMGQHIVSQIKQLETNAANKKWRKSSAKVWHTVI